MGDIPSRLTELDPDARDRRRMPSRRPQRAGRDVPGAAGLRARAQPGGRYRRVVGRGRPFNPALLNFLRDCSIKSAIIRLRMSKSRDGEIPMTYLAAAIQMNAGLRQGGQPRTRRAPGPRRGRARCESRRAARGLQLARQAREQAAAAETLEGQSLTLMSRLARELQIHILAGSITEQRRRGEPRCYNTSVLLGPDGARIAVYRKIHLFDVDLPGRVTARESDAKIAGADVVARADSARHDRAHDLLRPALPGTLPAARFSPARRSSRCRARSLSRPARRIGSR